MTYNFKRFIDAQKEYYDIALKEVKNKRKESHWIWFIFPQLLGLGRSDIADYFAISSLEEAKAYMENPYLRNNLLEITSAVLEIDDIDDAFGFPDNLKLRSSMTLFYKATGEEIFKKVIDKLYGGIEDEATLEMLELRRR